MATPKTPKYEITDKTTVLDGRTYHRIRALRDFNLANKHLVRKGTLGGYVQLRKTSPVLSQNGNCWIDSSSYVWDSSIGENAVINDNSRVFQSSVYGDTVVTNNSKVTNSTIKGCVGVTTWIFQSKLDDVTIKFPGEGVYLNSVRASDVRVRGSLRCDDSILSQVILSDNRDLSLCTLHNACLSRAILRNLQLSFDGTFDGCLRDAEILSQGDYLLQGPAQSSGRTTIAYRTRCSDAGQSREIRIATGCFEGNINQFEKAIQEKHTVTSSLPRRQYDAFANTIRETFNLPQQCHLQPMRPQPSKDVLVLACLQQAGHLWDQRHFFWLNLNGKITNVVNVVTEKSGAKRRKSVWFEISNYGLTPIKEPK